MNKEVIADITNRIISTLESGNVPIWEAPWQGDVKVTAPKNHTSPNIYRGFNFWNLIAAQLDQKHLSGEWMTYKQAAELGKQVRKGSKGSRVLFFTLKEKKDGKVKENGEKEKYPIMRYSTVFNLAQIEGFEADLLKGQPLNKIEKRADIDFSKTGAVIVEAPSLKAFYRGGDHDVIQLPAAELFTDADSYHAVKFHELIHWTGHRSRLNRPIGNEFGSKAYAFEELIAEFGASYLCAHYGFKYSTQHAAYISTWHKVLKEDPAQLISATSKAQKAADFIINLIDGQAPAVESEEAV